MYININKESLERRKKTFIEQNEEKRLNEEECLNFVNTPAFLEIFGKKDFSKEELAKYSIISQPDGTFKINYNDLEVEDQPQIKEYITNQYGVIISYLGKQSDGVGVDYIRKTKEGVIIKQHSAYDNPPYDSIATSNSTSYYINVEDPIGSYVDKFEIFKRGKTQALAILVYEDANGNYREMGGSHNVVKLPHFSDDIKIPIGIGLLNRFGNYQENYYEVVPFNEDEVLKLFDDNVSQILEYCPDSKKYYTQLRDEIKLKINPQYIERLATNYNYDALVKAYKNQGEKLKQILATIEEMIKNPFGKMLFEGAKKIMEKNRNGSDEHLEH